MLEYKYYYKGYTYIGTSYCYFEVENVNRNSVLNEKLLYLNQGKYKKVYLQEQKEKQANLFDYYFGHKLYAENNINLATTNLYIGSSSNVISHTKLVDYTKEKFSIDELFDYSQLPYKSFDKIPSKGIYKIIPKLSDSKFIYRYKDISRGRLTIQKSDEIINSTIRYKLHYGKLKGVDRKRLWVSQDVSEVTKKIGWSVGWQHNEHQPTWCNVFAIDLSRHMYGEHDGDSPVPYGGGNNNANALYEFFKKNPNDYVNLNKLLIKKPVLIWDYINKGYTVYFSGKANIGHIETGFPNIKVQHYGIFNKKRFNGSKKNSSLNTKSKYLSIGAGGITGYKSYDQYSFLAKSTKYLYLKYLNYKNENE